MTHEDPPSPKPRFPGQKHGEVVQIIVRKHWILDVQMTLMFVFLMLLPAFIASYVVAQFWDGTWTDAFILGALALNTYMLFMALIVFIKWLNEELDLIIVTNERIISHDQHDLFHRQISETSISQIQDVRGVEKGVLGSLLSYGYLEIQTAGKDNGFEVRNVANPYDNSRKIMDLREHYLDKEKFETPPTV